MTTVNGWPVWVLLLLVAWSLPWKGMALWRSARGGQKVWFIVLLLLNTVGLLEIIYLFVIAPRPSTPPAETSGS
jgi:hypothetical protein